ncbi:MAG TPA: fluoride efflux transporter CrcB [Thermoanaerobaculia bacterium]|nr:fluoride efflux transporter CrcB [Thermoanaerobaculia bacterium]
MIARCLVVGAGGFLGAIARYAVGVWIENFWRRDFPLATFLVNVSGCFILGFFLAMATERMSISPMMRLLVATGFVGAYTTFSTFEYETQRLTTTGAFGWALVNVLASVAFGFLAVRLGVQLGRR